MSIAVGELNRMQDMLDLYLGCKIENIGLVIYVVTVDSYLGTLKILLTMELQVLRINLNLDPELMGLVVSIVTVDSCLGTLKVHLATEHQVLTVKLDLDFILELMSLVVAVVTDGNY